MKKERVRLTYSDDVFGFKPIIEYKFFLLMNIYIPNYSILVLIFVLLLIIILTVLMMSDEKEESAKVKDA